jgi:hypothetical protein
MKNLEVNWINEPPVKVEVTRKTIDSTTPAAHGAGLPAVLPENLIVITCSGGVLRQWPARDGNSVW